VVAVTFSRQVASRTDLVGEDGPAPGDLFFAVDRDDLSRLIGTGRRVVVDGARGGFWIVSEGGRRPKADRRNEHADGQRGPAHQACSP